MGGLFQQQHFPDFAHRSMLPLHFWLLALFCSPAEEGCPHAEVHPGGEHHHALLCTVGPGWGHGVHRSRAEHQHGRQQPTEWAGPLQDAQGVGEDGVQEPRYGRNRLLVAGLCRVSMQTVMIVEYIVLSIGDRTVLILSEHRSLAKYPIMH